MDPEPSPQYPINKELMDSIKRIDIKSRCNGKCKEVFEFCLVETDEEITCQRGWWYKVNELGSGIFCDNCIGDLRFAKFRALSNAEIRKGRCYNAKTLGHHKLNDEKKPVFSLEMVLNGAPGGVASTNRNSKVKIPDPVEVKIKKDIIPRPLPHPTEELDLRQQYLVSKGYLMDPMYIDIY
jgi:hypothetical protein